MFLTLIGPCTHTSYSPDVMEQNLLTGGNCYEILALCFSDTLVEQGHVLLHNFVRLLPILYGDEQERTFNSHAFLYLSDQILDNGSLLLMSDFVLSH